MTDSYDTKFPLNHFPDSNWGVFPEEEINPSIRKLVSNRLTEIGFWDHSTHLTIVVQLPTDTTIEKYEMMCRIILTEGWRTPALSSEQKSELQEFIEGVIRFNYDGEF